MIQANVLLAIAIVAGGAFGYRQLAGGSAPGPAPVVDTSATEEKLLEAVIVALDGQQEAAVYRAELYRGIAELVLREEAVKSTNQIRNIHAMAGTWTFAGRIEPLPDVNAAAEKYLAHVMDGRPNIQLDATVREKLSQAFTRLAEACEKAVS